ncbi:MAG: AsmA family protein [Hyphomicrobiales bacterium]
MKLWKSPILYIGVLLVIAVAAALAAPYVVDWGRYRPTIEAYGSDLAGRKVVVNGPISARLFPWPRLTLEDVRVANVAGASAPEFLSAKRVDIRMSLSGFLNGSILVEGIEVTSPRIAIERMASGTGNWRVVSSPNLLKTGLLSHIKLDRIAVRDGTINLIDARRNGMAEVGNIELVLSSPALGGPWRVRGTGKYKDQPIELSIDTGSYRPDAPFKFGFRVAPADGSGLAFSFDGENDGSRVAGQLKIEPAPQVGGKTDAEGDLRPMVLRAQASSDFDTLELKKIEIAPRDGEPGANLVTGEAMVRLGETIGIDAQFTASRFDLDTIAGAKARTLLREGRALSLLESIVEGMPENLEARTELKIRSLVAGGETLENVRLDVAVLDGALRIHELSASMPGQSEGLFDGIFLVTDSGPQLAGDVALASQNLREFARWAWPEGSDWIAAHWTGSRGRLKLQTRIDLLNDKYRATEASFEIDDTHHTGSLTITGGAEPHTDIVLDSDVLDLDSFVSGGLLGGTGMAVMKAFTEPASSQKSAGWPRISLALNANQLRLNGTEARDTRIEIASSAKSLDLKRVEIGRVGDAKLEISGLINSTADGPTGRVTTHMVASDPRGMMRLLGLASPESDPPWLSALGETNVAIISELKPDRAGSQFVVDVKGKSGGYGISGSAALAMSADGVRQVSGSLDVATETSSALARLGGLQPVAAIETPGRLQINASGDLKAGVEIDAQADVFDAKFGYRGRLTEADGVYATQGRGGFNSDRPTALLKAIGLSWPVTGLVSVEANISSAKDKISLAGIQAVAGKERLSGDLTIEGKKVKGEVTGGALALTDLLAATLLPWTGDVPDPEGPFANGLPLGLTGEVWLKPHTLAIVGGAEIAESQIGITATDSSVEFAVFGTGSNREKVSFNLLSRREGDGRAIEGKMSLPGDLAQLLRTADGNPVATGTIDIETSFRGAGRSLASALADLDGGGTYALHGVSLERIDPVAFGAAARIAKSADDVRLSLHLLTTGRALSLPDAEGTVTATDGRVALLPITSNGADADVQIKPTADLATGSLDIEASLQLKAIPDLPAMQIVYSGSPIELVRSVDMTALESFLGIKVLREGMSELERLQEEQMKALEEEERYRREDEQRYQDYLAQRRELQMRQRELDVHRKMLIEQEKREKEEAKKKREEEAKKKREEARKAKQQPTTEASVAEPAPLEPIILVPPDPDYVPQPDPWPFGGLMPTDSEQMQRLKVRQR